jgi:hypothetical protein
VLIFRINFSRDVKVDLATCDFHVSLQQNASTIPEHTLNTSLAKLTFAPAECYYFKTQE